MATLTDAVVPPGAVAIHWFGQSWYACKDAAGTVVQVDPYGPHTRPPQEFIHPTPPLDEATLPTDYVLLTHEHGDHTCVETLARIHAAFPAAHFYGPHESLARMRAAGMPADLLHQVTAGESWQMGSIIAHAVWAKPPTGAPDDGIPAPDVEHLGYVLDFGGTRVYVSGDPIHTFSRHGELLAPIKAYRPHLGLLTCHPTEGEFPDFVGAVEIAIILGLEGVVPAHYGCFVHRTYDPLVWAAGFPLGGPTPIVIPYNEAIVYQAGSKGSV